MNSKSITWGTVIGVLLAALGIIAPIVWDLYKGKAELELQHLSSATLVENRMQLDKLKITYDGKPIRALSKVVFAFVNSGRTAILQEHLKVPPTINFGTNVEILEVHVDDRKPSSLEVVLGIATNKEDLVVQFPLMNPGDSMTLSALLSGNARELAGNARIVNVKGLTFVDRRLEVTSKRIDWKVYVVGGFSGLCYLVFIGVSIDFRKELRTRAVFNSPTFEIHPVSSAEAYEELIRKYFPGRTNSELRPLRVAIGEIRGGVILIEQHRKIVRLMTKLANTSETTASAMVGAFVLATIGAIFVISKVF